MLAPPVELAPPARGNSGSATVVVIETVKLLNILQFADHKPQNKGVHMSLFFKTCK